MAPLSPDIIPYIGLAPITNAVNLFVAKPTALESSPTLPPIAFIDAVPKAISFSLLISLRAFAKSGRLLLVKLVEVLIKSSTLFLPCSKASLTPAYAGPPDSRILSSNF